MSNQPRGNGPRCDDRCCGHEAGFFGSRGRIAGPIAPPPSFHAFLQRDAELGSVLDFTSSSVDAVGELDQRHASLPCFPMVNRQIRHHMSTPSRRSAAGLHFFSSFAPSLAECSMDDVRRHSTPASSASPSCLDHSARTAQRLLKKCNLPADRREVVDMGYGSGRVHHRQAGKDGMALIELADGVTLDEVIKTRSEFPRRAEERMR